MGRMTGNPITVHWVTALRTAAGRKASKDIHISSDYSKKTAMTRIKVFEN